MAQGWAEEPVLDLLRWQGSYKAYHALYSVFFGYLSWAISREMYGAPDPNRTGNLLLRRQSLYPKLSYRRKIIFDDMVLRSLNIQPGDYTLKPGLVPDNELIL